MNIIEKGSKKIKIKLFNFNRLSIGRLTIHNKRSMGESNQLILCFQ